MREQMRESGFSPPTFESDRAKNSFTSRLLLHHFLHEEDLAWLRLIPHEMTESQRYALIFVWEQGAINNQTLRQLTGGEVLAVSQDLRKLRDLDLLVLKGKGSATCYLPGPDFPTQPPVHVTLGSKHGTLSSRHGTLAADHGTLAASLPTDFRSKLEALGKRPGEKIRPMILDLCAWRALTAAELAELFGRSDTKALKRDHLGPMIAGKELEYTHPDMERHPKQAYRTADPKSTP